jgi:hypothetical protein
VLRYVDSCGEKTLRKAEKCFFLFMARCLAFDCCMMLAKAARSPEAIASLSVCGVAAAKFLGPRPNESGDDVPVEARQADLSTFALFLHAVDGAPLNQRTCQLNHFFIHIMASIDFALLPYCTVVLPSRVLKKQYCTFSTKIVTVAAESSRVGSSVSLIEHEKVQAPQGLFRPSLETALPVSACGTSPFGTLMIQGYERHVLLGGILEFLITKVNQYL